METATAEMQGIARQLQKQYAAANREEASATLVPLRDVVVGEARVVLGRDWSGAT